MKTIKLQPELEKAVMDLGFSEFTEIQEKCIPLIQAGKDVIGQSFTGSGKTAAFGFPMLEKIEHGKGLQALVLVPTRELCNQVAKELMKFSKYKRTQIIEIYGGVSINPQIWNLPKADVVVATPGRILDHMQRGTIDLSRVKILVLDEADRMFDMGFIDDIRKIISQIPRERQTLLFSATISHDVMNIAKNYMINPERVKMQEYVDKSKLIQHYYDVERNDKFSLLLHILRNNRKGLAIVFCATKRMVDAVSRNLFRNNIKAQGLHGDLSQNQRKRVMEDFHANKLDALVASDVAARGLDIKHVGLVVNFDIPRTSQDYVHRIGRTARAGAEGQVISFVSSADHDNFRRVLEDRSLLIQKMKLPEFERIQFANKERRHDGKGGFQGPKFGRNEGRGFGKPRFGGGRSFGNRFERRDGPKFIEEGEHHAHREHSEKRFGRKDRSNFRHRENRFRDEGQSSSHREYDSRYGRESDYNQRENRFSRNERFNRFSNRREDRRGPRHRRDNFR